MSSDRDAANLVFEKGVHWQAGFVKRGTVNGRAIGFKLSPQLVSNHLATEREPSDPVHLVISKERAVRAACVRAYRRAGERQLGGLIHLIAEDFDETLGI